MFHICFVGFHGLSQLEINDGLDDRSSWEVHAYDSKAPVLVGLGLQVLVQPWVDSLCDSPGMGEHTSSTGVG